MIGGIRRINRVVLTLSAFAVLFAQCTDDASSSSSSAAGSNDAVARQVECFENNPPLFYDEAGACYSADPTGRSDAEKLLLAVTPTARGGEAANAIGGSAAPVAPGSAAGPINPALGDEPVRSPLGVGPG